MYGQRGSWHCVAAQCVAIKIVLRTSRLTPPIRTFRDFTSWAITSIERTTLQAGSILLQLKL